MVDGAVPLINALETFRRFYEIRSFPVEDLEQMMFPARTANVEVLKAFINTIRVLASAELIAELIEGNEALTTRLKEDVHDRAQELRYAYESVGVMPYNLSDEEVFRWHKDYLNSQSQEH